MPIGSSVESPHLQNLDFLLCIKCNTNYDAVERQPVNLGCGHTVCKVCLGKIDDFKCPIDQTKLSEALHNFPVNFALLHLVNAAAPASPHDQKSLTAIDRCLTQLAAYLKPIHNGATTSQCGLTESVHQRILRVISMQHAVPDGPRLTAQCAVSLVERCVLELLLRHQISQQVSSTLWAAVRARGCQFLGSAMQEQVLRLLLLALHDGSFLSRKVLVLFVVHKLDTTHAHVSKTAVGHVVQLLYRASCFKVMKRDDDSSLMQLKEEVRTYESLRSEHDAQIVTIALEAGLHISAEQWSSLLYGDAEHRSHMENIIDKLQGPQSLRQLTQQLKQALHKTGDPGDLRQLLPQLDKLSQIDSGGDDTDASPPRSDLADVMQTTVAVVMTFANFMQQYGSRRLDLFMQHKHNYKTVLCRDIQHGVCPRGIACSFAHSPQEVDRYRMNARKNCREQFVNEKGDPGRNAATGHGASDTVNPPLPHVASASTHRPVDLPHSTPCGYDAQTADKPVCIVERLKHMQISPPTLPQQPAPPPVHQPALLAQPAPSYPSDGGLSRRIPISSLRHMARAPFMPLVRPPPCYPRGPPTSTARPPFIQPNPLMTSQHTHRLPPTFPPFVPQYTSVASPHQTSIPSQVSLPQTQSLNPDASAPPLPPPPPFIPNHQTLTSAQSITGPTVSSSSSSPRQTHPTQPSDTKSCSAEYFPPIVVASSEFTTFPQSTNPINSAARRLEPSYPSPRAPSLPPDGLVKPRSFSSSREIPLDLQSQAMTSSLNIAELSGNSVVSISTQHIVPTHTQHTVPTHTQHDSNNAPVIADVDLPSDHASPVTELDREHTEAPPVANLHPVPYTILESNKIPPFIRPRLPFAPPPIQLPFPLLPPSIDNCMIMPVIHDQIPLEPPSLMYDGTVIVPQQADTGSHDASFSAEIHASVVTHDPVMLPAQPPIVPLVPPTAVMPLNESNQMPVLPASDDLHPVGADGIPPNAFVMKDLVTVINPYQAPVPFPLPRLPDPPPVIMPPLRPLTQESIAMEDMEGTTNFMQPTSPYPYISPFLHPMSVDPSQNPMMKYILPHPSLPPRLRLPSPLSPMFSPQLFIPYPDSHHQMAQFEVPPVYTSSGCIDESACIMDEHQIMSDENLITTDNNIQFYGQYPNFNETGAFVNVLPLQSVVPSSQYRSSQQLFVAGGDCMNHSSSSKDRLMHATTPVAAAEPATTSVTAVPHSAHTPSQIS